MSKNPLLFRGIEGRDRDRVVLLYFTKCSHRKILCEPFEKGPRRSHYRPTYTGCLTRRVARADFQVVDFNYPPVLMLQVFIGSNSFNSSDSLEAYQATSSIGLGQRRTSLIQPMLFELLTKLEIQISNFYVNIGVTKNMPTYKTGSK